MKKFNIYSILLLFGILFFASCEKPEGALYTGPANKVSFLNSSTNLAMTDGILQVPIARTSTDGEFTAPVTLTAKGKGYTNVFKISTPVTFAAGEAKTYVKVGYSDYSSIDPEALSVVGQDLDVVVGLAFPFSLIIDKDAVSYSQISKVDVMASSILKFKDHGNATLDSRQGFYEAKYDVKIEKAEGVNVYKLIQPFGQNNFAFMINSDNSVSCPKQVIGNDQKYGPVSMKVEEAKYIPEDNAVVLKVGGYTVSAGSFGSGLEIIYLP